MTEKQGQPCWYELCTGKGSLTLAGEFYSKVIGWQVQDAGMEGFTYHLAAADGDMVSGLMEIPDEAGDMPPFWMIYFATPNCDETVALISEKGGSVHKAPDDIPGVGRFAIVADPQGAAFGLLQSLEPGAAFAQEKPGHGSWHELMSTGWEAGFAFYNAVFGWEKSDAFDMGDMGTYQLFSHDGNDIGGMMGLGPAPVSCWLPYFGTESAEASAELIKSAGGEIFHGPMEVPGGTWIVVGKDPQGAMFALAGGK